MPAVCRAGLDKHIGHSRPKDPFHQTPYVGSQTKVNAEGGAVIVDGDKAACGDPVLGFSAKVTVGGKGVHRVGDATSGHSGWVPNAAATGAPKVTAG